MKIEKLAVIFALLLDLQRQEEVTSGEVINALESIYDMGICLQVK